MPKQIVYFTKYSRNGASSRLRSYQYIDKLQNEVDVAITVQTLFSEQYLVNLYNNKSTFLHVLLGYFARFFFLFSIFKYDKIVIEKELFPFMPAFYEWLFQKFKIKYIVDFDDAIFHNYDQHSNFFVRKLLKNKVAVVMQCADSVIVGNEYLKKYALNAQAKKVIVIPTVIDIERYKPKEAAENNSVLALGWIGTPKTIRLFQGNLKYFEDNYQQNFKIITIGAALRDTILKTDFIEWSELTEVDNIKKIDVGLMPLLDSDFEKGKCGYKLIQFMACGIPVIASAVGANTEIVKNGINGFLVHQPSDWSTHINYFIQNPDQVKKLGQQALQTVYQKYTLQVQYPIIKQILGI